MVSTKTDWSAFVEGLKLHDELKLGLENFSERSFIGLNAEFDEDIDDGRLGKEPNDD